MADRFVDDAALAAAFKAHTATVLVGRNPSAVAAEAMSRNTRPGRLGMPVLATVALALVAAVSVAVFQFSGQTGSQPSTMDVNGVTYGLVAARSLVVTEGDLTPYADATGAASDLPLAGRTAYAIRGVDPGHALVVPLQPGAADDVGSLGRYALLIRGSFADLCHLFDGSSPATPTECRR